MQGVLPTSRAAVAKSQRDVPEKRLKALPMPKGPAASSSVLARRSKINSRGSHRGGALLKVTEDLQKSGGSWCEIGEATQFLQVWEKWRVEKNHRFWISTSNQLCAKIPFPLQQLVHAQVLGRIFVIPDLLCSSRGLKEEQMYCFLLTKMI